MYLMLKAKISKYDMLFPFHEDLGRVKVKDRYTSKEKYGFVTLNGDEIIEPIYDFASDFKEGFAKVLKGSIWGFVSKNGEEIAFNYEEVGEFFEGYARVKKNGKWGYIRKEGPDSNPKIREVIPCTYDLVGDFSNGRALVTSGTDSYYIDHFGTVIVNLGNEFKEIGNFYNGISRLESDFQETVYLNQTGKTIAKFPNSIGGNFTNNLAYVEKTETDTNNNLVNYASVILPTGEKLFETKDFSIMGNANEHGNFIVNFHHEEIGLVNRFGKEITKRRFQAIYEASDGMMRFKENDKYGFMDLDGNIVIPAIYERAENFGENRALVKIANAKFGYIDKTNTLVIPAIFDFGYKFSSKRAIVEINSKFFYIDDNGKLINMAKTKDEIIYLKIDEENLDYLCDSIPKYVQEYEAIGYRTDFLLDGCPIYAVIGKISDEEKYLQKCALASEELSKKYVKSF